MQIIKVKDMPEGFELRKDYDGYKFVLVYKEMDILRKVAEWKEAPITEEILISISRWEKK